MNRILTTITRSPIFYTNSIKYSQSKPYPSNQLQTRTILTSTLPTPSHSSNSNTTITKRPFSFYTKTLNLLPRSLTTTLGLLPKTETEMTQEQIKNTISQTLKKANAPLAIRLLAKIVTPLISKLGAQFKDHARIIDKLQGDAKVLILTNKRLLKKLGGENIQMSPPFLNNSSNVNVNGSEKSEALLKMIITGAKSNGTVTVKCKDGNIEDLKVQMRDGEMFDVDVNGRMSKFEGSTHYVKKGKERRFGAGEDEVFEAEYTNKR